MKVKEESEKVGLKLNIQKTKIMASGRIISWQIDGETMETVTDFILGGFKITADGDCSHKIKLLLGRKSVTNLDSILKSRDITLPTKIHLVKDTFFSVVMYGYESWTIKKAEHWRIDALNCGVGEDSWEYLGQQGDQTSLAKGNQAWIFIGKTDAETETPILWPPDVKSWLIWKDPDAGKHWRREEKVTTKDDGWMASPTQCTWVWVNSGSRWWTGKPDVHGVTKSRIWLSDWTDMTERLNWLNLHW